MSDRADAICKKAGHGVSGVNGIVTHSAFRRIGICLRQLAAAFSENRRGATAVEFALVALPFVALVAAMLQTAVIFFAGQALQSVTMAAARQILVGNAQVNGLTAAQFQSQVCSMAPSLFACPKIMVDIQSATSFSSLNTAPITVTYNSSGNPTNLSYLVGSQGSAVILRVMYEWPVIGGPLGIGLANESNGNHLMVGTAVFKTEPY